MRLLIIPLLALLACPACAGERPAASPLRMVGEFEDQPGLLVGCAQLLFHHPAAMIDLTRAVDDDTVLFGLVSNRAQADSMGGLLAAAGLPRQRIRPVIVKTNSMWVRDYGPTILQEGKSITLVDARYTNPEDDLAPTRLGKLWGMPVRDSALWLEGGHIVQNGNGLLLMSTMIASVNHKRENLDEAGILDRVRAALPFREAHWVRPLEGEPTGHLDMFLCFLGPDRIMLADIREDPSLAASLDELAGRLEGMGLAVTRIPTPAPRDDLWFTYTNVILIGNQIILPVYPELGEEANRRAIATWRSAMPDRDLKTVDASTLIRRHGALHCVSMPVPVLPR